MNPSVYGSLPGSACALSTVGSMGPDRITRNTYDPASRITVVQSGYATTWVQNTRTQGYTDNGLIDWVEDANGNRSDYAYDPFMRLYRLYFPSTTLAAHAANPSDYEEYGYDANGNLTSRRLRSKDTLGFTYDAPSPRRPRSPVLRLDVRRLLLYCDAFSFSAKARPWSGPFSSPPAAPWRSPAPPWPRRPRARSRRSSSPGRR